MKTAMQELIDWINQYEGQMISADQVVLKAHKLLENERYQIINAWNYGNIPRCEPSAFNNGIEYYNQNYNHLHILTDGNVGLSNPSETTNNKLTINETKRSIENIGLNNQNK